MKNLEILKRLKAISEAMTENSVEVWDGKLTSSITAVVMEDFKTDDRGTVEYNGWSDDLEKLISDLEGHKEPTKMDVMVNEFVKYIAVDDATNEEIENEIKNLQLYLCKDETLDHILSDKFCPSVSFEFSFTVESFLDQIDIKGYE